MGVEAKGLTYRWPLSPSHGCAESLRVGSGEAEGLALRIFLRNACY